MRIESAQSVADAVLYEGYILYPYRPSSLKNRQRWTFGGVFPLAFAGRQGDSAFMQTQVLVRLGHEPVADVYVRFLQVVARAIGVDESASLAGEPRMTFVPRLEVDGLEHLAWDEATEREIAIEAIRLDDWANPTRRFPFAFEASRTLEPIRTSAGETVAMWVRTSEAIEGEVEISTERIDTDLARLTVRIVNTTPLSPSQLEERDTAQRRAFVATHAILGVRGGAFVSLLDPPDDLLAAAAACDNQGAFPVLIGPPDGHEAVLASPIILYDHPQIAPESPGDLFDGTEIDEILILRILAMTDAEKREMASADPRARAMLDRAHVLTAEDFARLHGTMRGNAAASAKTPRALSVGGQVRIRPKPGGDIMDVALRDKLAVIEAIERDYEDRIHVAVTLVDDPGRDLGAAGFPGHRFYFSQDEVEPVEAGGGV